MSPLDALAALAEEIDADNAGGGDVYLSVTLRGFGVVILGAIRTEGRDRKSQRVVGYRLVEAGGLDVLRFEAASVRADLKRTGFR